LRGHLGEEPNETSGRLFNANLFPSSGKKEIDDPRSIHGRPLMGPCAKSKVLCQDRPAAFPVKRGDPFFVKCLDTEFIPQSNNLVIVKEGLKSPRKLGAEIVV
jgi:hypothetical protein